MGHLARKQILPTYLCSILGYQTEVIIHNACAQTAREPKIVTIFINSYSFMKISNHSVSQLR